MRKFIKKFTLFCIPFLILIIIGLNLDLLKVFKSYDNYYEANNFITLNRTLVSTKVLLKHKKKANYNAFIFGSSRSQAFKAEQWKNYLPENANAFHYDGISEDIYGIYKKLEFLDSQHFKINHALLIIDRSTLVGTKKRDAHLQINPIEFNDVSPLKFYWVNFKAALDPKFLLSYIDYSVFNKHRSYMKTKIRHYKYPDSFTPIYNDTYYAYDKLIAEDSLGYYELMHKKRFFRKRPTTVFEDNDVSNEEIRLLKAIDTIFKKHNTSYKIVVSPMYNQIPMEHKQIELLNTIFNKDAIYDFSGINKLTIPISNYYEYSHFRPVVANKILDSIY
jgi:hypothetical protein